MTKLKNWISGKIHASLQKKGYHLQLVYVEERLLAAAKFAIAEAERVGAAAGKSGIAKQQDADRMLSNICPAATAHDRATAIQVAMEVIRNG